MLEAELYKFLPPTLPVQVFEDIFYFNGKITRGPASETRQGQSQLLCGSLARAGLGSEHAEEPGELGLPLGRGGLGKSSSRE